MATNIFVNLPVKDLERSKAFYTAIGFSINPQFSDDKAACVVVSENIFVMILLEHYFKTFIKKEVSDYSKTSEVIVCLSAESRDKVDEVVNKALANGGAPSNDAKDHGFMYVNSFADPDGHLWEFSWMDEAAFAGQE
jgi:uncharacterized protein